MIIGLMILAGLAVYLIITIMVVMIAVKRAHKKGKPGWKAGCLALGVMYLLLFWDLIPMHVAQQYYCNTQAGFIRYKSLEQWQQETQEGIELFDPAKDVSSELSNNRARHFLNNRFAWDIFRTKEFLGIRKREEHIVDMKTGEILAQYIDFNSGQSQHEPHSIRDLKIWLWTESCESGDLPQQIKFNDYQQAIGLLGREKHGS